MDQQIDKKERDIWEYIIPGGLLFLSYVLLYYLPQAESWKFWVVFVISVFVFCVGYFRLLESLPKATSQTGSAIKTLIPMILGMGMFIFGLHYVYIDNGSIKSLAKAWSCAVRSAAAIREPGSFPELFFGCLSWAWPLSVYGFLFRKLPLKPRTAMGV